MSIESELEARAVGFAVGDGEPQAGGFGDTPDDAQSPVEPSSVVVIAPISGLVSSP
jgi:hypothetical protein